MLWLLALPVLWASVAVVVGLFVGHGIRMERGLECEHPVATGPAGISSPGADQAAEPTPAERPAGPAADSSTERAEDERRTVPDFAPHLSGVR
jgi:hypothetical protein